MSRFREAEVFRPDTNDWEFLPFRFERLNGKVLVTNMVGEHLILERCGGFFFSAKYRHSDHITAIAPDALNGRAVLPV